MSARASVFGHRQVYYTSVAFQTRFSQIQVSSNCGQLISGSTRPIITNFWIYLYLCIGNSNLTPFDKKRCDKKGLKKGRFFKLFSKYRHFFLIDFSKIVVNYCVRKLP